MRGAKNKYLKIKSNDYINLMNRNLRKERLLGEFQLWVSKK